jgi:hypothetical protein
MALLLPVQLGCQESPVVLNGSFERQPPCFVSNLGENVYLSPLTYGVSNSFFVDACFWIEDVP